MNPLHVSDLVPLGVVDSIKRSVMPVQKLPAGIDAPASLLYPHLPQILRSDIPRMSAPRGVMSLCCQPNPSQIPVTLPAPIVMRLIGTQPAHHRPAQVRHGRGTPNDKAFRTRPVPQMSTGLVLSCPAVQHLSVDSLALFVPTFAVRVSILTTHKRPAEKSASIVGIALSKPETSI
jgi:hypothetical protein